MKLSRGEKFLEARKIHNRHGKQTQAEVYAATGIPSSKIKDLEDDDKERGVDYREIARLAEYYGVSLDYLIGDSDDPRLTADQKAAAAYLRLSDFATGRLAEMVASGPRKQLFESLIQKQLLSGVLQKIEGASAEIRKLNHSLHTGDEARHAEYEARHIQRDLSDDIAGMLAEITGFTALRYNIRAILEQEKQEQGFEDYKALLDDLALWQEIPDGEHPED